LHSQQQLSDKKRVLICRLGAIGDSIITTPLVRLIEQLGHEVFYLTSEVGAHVLANNPRISKIITHKKDSVPSDQLGTYFAAVAQQEECDYWIDLCESLEVNLALYPSDPRYKYTKSERKELCDKNYYHETIRIAQAKCELLQGVNIDEIDLQPEMFFTSDEDNAMRKTIAGFNGAFVVLIGLSGSNRQKTFPFTRELIDQLTKEAPGIQFITVGDEPCQILEYNLAPMDNVLCTSGIWDVRQSVLAAKYASLVIAPDTGLLHGAGCFDTPKIALLTNTTAINITNTFKNVSPFQAKVACAPCFYLIYDADTQCNLGRNRSCLCMDKGIPVDEIVNKALEIYYYERPKTVLEVVSHV
jgi:ADP-heptose:LPS heptosyltransferase